ncbi:hypothetical protein [Actinokineospora diospyrosa]|uniref:DUF222 domain-containing protein n=1 Tax=Actinokineospora diospyrosa TaxID=103728 RepID=A0ABT1IAA0_9PSEU|nr:hypothetical protein [Actinokineospora diospyrosa]MCP2269281.1 hypothetical protein [Actinokineospora diospyrosa]
MARRDGRALFPLAATHYAETIKIKDPAQRRDLATVMEELSGFATLIDRTVVARLEVDAALNDRFGPMPTPAAEYPLLGCGVAWTFGMKGGLSILDEQDNDVTGDERDRVGAAVFDARMTAAQLMLERTSLAGPSDSEVPALHAHGWDPDAAATVMTRRAAQEQSFQDHLATFRGGELDSWTRGERLRDVVLEREVQIELGDILDEVLAAHGLRPDTVLPDSASIRALLRSMPSTEVATTLKTEDHRNAHKSWTSNDIFDIDALSLAVPYCDVVVCDAHRSHVLRTAKLDRRMNTTVINKLTDLPRHLTGAAHHPGAPHASEHDRHKRGHHPNV